ncbi:MAG: NAD(P)/FAD-dependent oxidoreductase, partial [Oscillospiraceae bacterium]|nr:NAD(P)/FAD-dependent oxidoreductase [Oscillospiraceae bacterium]
MYDVIVIGAGPAGCCAAKILAERGRSVLLVEKFSLPRYKSCSGVLIKKTLELTERYFGEAIPELSMCEPVENRGMIFTDDKGREYRFEQDGRNVWRSEYDNWLAQKAVSAGTELRDNIAAIGLTELPDGVELTLGGRERYTEKSRYVIDCEGVVGAFKRQITKTAGEYVTTYQTFNDGTIDLDPHYFYAYLQPQLSEYDAWFNVKDNKLVLGVSAMDTSKIARYYTNFLEYMRKAHGLTVTSQLKEEKWLMPRIRPGFVIEYAIGRTFFAGEIAGFLNPMGEGISAALESGQAAACAIDGSFSEP